jgi:hypothetical protein
MSLAVLKGQPQNESTELESLMYSMLYAATKGKLHWGAYLHTDSAARDAKVAAMSSGSEFEALVLSRIDDALLKRIAKCLRALFLSTENACKVYQSKTLLLQYIKAMQSRVKVDWAERSAHA